jgi:hypothetical protein
VNDPAERFTALYDRHYRSVLGYTLPRAGQDAARTALASLGERDVEATVVLATRYGLSPREAARVVGLRDDPHRTAAPGAQAAGPATRRRRRRPLLVLAGTAAAAAVVAGLLAVPSGPSRHEDARTRTAPPRALDARSFLLASADISEKAPVTEADGVAA